MLHFSYPHTLIPSHLLLPMPDDIWEARPPVQLIAAVSIVAAVVTLDAVALGATMQTGLRTPEPPGALAIALACGQVAVAAIFFTLGSVGFRAAGADLGGSGRLWRGTRDAAGATNRYAGTPAAASCSSWPAWSPCPERCCGCSASAWSTSPRR